MAAIQLNMYHAVALAAVLFWLGDMLTQKVTIFSRYCIPAPLVGGLCFAALNSILYMAGLPYFVFDTTLQTLFMTMFFTTVGFTVSLPLLVKGGKAVLVCLALSSVMVFLQNGLGAAAMLAMGENPILGLAVGSISMVGGPGTAAAFGPDLEAAGAAGGCVVSMAAATFGLVAGSLMGGPIARRLIVKHRLYEEASGENFEVAVEDNQFSTCGPRLVKAFMLIMFCVGVGSWVSTKLQEITGMTFPGYIGAMLVAVFVRNVMIVAGQEYPESEIDGLGGVCLCLFLSMAMMTLKLWELIDLALPMMVSLGLQMVLMYFFAVYVVFPLMGRNYDAAVMTSGFIGFGMGATSNAMANMQAVTRQYGPSPTAYFAIPMVGGMFIDFVNAIVIAVTIPFLGTLA